MTGPLAVQEYIQELIRTLPDSKAMTQQTLKESWKDHPP